MPYRVSDLIRHLDNAMGSLNRPDSVAAYQLVKTPHHRAAARCALRLHVRHQPDAARRDVGHPVAAVPHPGQRQADHDPRSVGRALRGAERRGVGDVPAHLRFRGVERERRSRSPSSARRRTATRRATRTPGSSRSKRALSRIAKEGRKYGVSLCVVSQRPSDLAPSLLSECNTLFALRMTNQDDQDIIRGALPEASHGLMKFLPALRNGEAIVGRRRRVDADAHLLHAAARRLPPAELHRLVHHRLVAGRRRPLRGRADRRALAPRRPPRGLIRNLRHRA